MQLARHVLSCSTCCAEPRRAMVKHKWEVSKTQLLGHTVMLCVRGDAATAVDARTRGQDGMTPLHSAALHGKFQAVQLLLDSGADPDAQDQVLGALWHRL